MDHLKLKAKLRSSWTHVASIKLAVCTSHQVDRLPGSIVREWEQEGEQRAGLPGAGCRLRAQCVITVSVTGNRRLIAPFWLTLRGTGAWTLKEKSAQCKADTAGFSLHTTPSLLKENGMMGKEELRSHGWAVTCDLRQLTWSIWTSLDPSISVLISVSTSCLNWGREWQTTPVLLPRERYEQ